MKVFISWSGDRSRAIAEELRYWLPTIVQSLEPFISTQDVPVGDVALTYSHLNFRIVLSEFFVLLKRISKDNGYISRLGPCPK